MMDDNPSLDTGHVPMAELLKTEYLREQQLLDLLPVGVYACDVQGNITHYNKKALELWGRKPATGNKTDNFCGAFKLFDACGNPLTREESPMARCLHQQQPCTDEDVWMERTDGSKILVRINTVALKDDAGTLQGMACCFYDITLQQKEMERKTRELRDYVDNATIGLHWVDANGIIKWANRAELEMLGYTEEEYIGQHISKFHASEEKINDILERLGCNETLQGYEAELRCKDGSTRTVSISSNVYQEDGRFIHTRCFTVDISEQKRLFRQLSANEQRLEELTHKLEVELQHRLRDLEQKNAELIKSEERYHKMIEEVEDYAILLLDSNGIVQNWNLGAEKIKGYKESEIVGRHFRTFYMDADRKKGLPERLLQEARDRGKAIHEGWRQRKDGTKFWGSIVITALHDAKGGVVGFSKVTRDLTERKNAEDRMRDYAHQLEFQNRELEQFAYAASHDMKEPLRKISFYNTYIVEHASTQLDEKSRECIHRSLAAVKRMTDLIDDLLAYSRMTIAEVTFEPTDLHEIVEEIALSHKDLTDQQLVQFHIGSLPVVQGIPFQLKQLLDNLVNNSIKYKHPNRNVQITIDSELLCGDKITGGEPALHYYRISVTDNGVGFDEHYAAKIFEIFQRLNNPASYKGSGIGLAICKKIVQNHHGMIEAHGTEGVGASFDVYLPV